MVVKIIEILPSLLWFGFIVFIAIKFYRPLRYELFPRLTGISVKGVELSFLKESIDAALELAEKHRNWKVEIPDADREEVLRRAQEHCHIFKNALFLWVDDVSSNNRNERRMFRQLHVDMEIARNTDEALEMLAHDTYDLVISDMARGSDKAAGVAMLQQFKNKGYHLPVIFYIGVYHPERGVPPGAFGITNRPDELLHLVLDALERKRY